MPKPYKTRSEYWLEQLPKPDKLDLEKKLTDLLPSRKYGEPGFGRKPGPVLIKKLIRRLHGRRFAA